MNRTASCSRTVSEDHRALPEKIRLSWIRDSPAYSDPPVLPECKRLSWSTSAAYGSRDPLNAVMDKVNQSKQHSEENSSISSSEELNPERQNHLQKQKQKKPRWFYNKSRSLFAPTSTTSGPGPNASEPDVYRSQSTIEVNRDSESSIAPTGNQRSCKVVLSRNLITPAVTSMTNGYKSRETTTNVTSDQNTSTKPDVLLNDNDFWSFDNEEVTNRSMIDFISVDAPDDTLIKPSKLRASMNSRRRDVTSVGVGDATGAPVAFSRVRRAGSLRETTRAVRGQHGGMEEFAKAWQSGSVHNLENESTGQGYINVGNHLQAAETGTRYIKQLSADFSRNGTEEIVKPIIKHANSGECRRPRVVSLGESNGYHRCPVRPLENAHSSVFPSETGRIRNVCLGQEQTNKFPLDHRDVSSFLVVVYHNVSRNCKVSLPDSEVRVTLRNTDYEPYPLIIWYFVSQVLVHYCPIHVVTGLCLSASF